MSDFAYGLTGPLTEDEFKQMLPGLVRLQVAFLRKDPGAEIIVFTRLTDDQQRRLRLATWSRLKWRFHSGE